MILTKGQLVVLRSSTTWINEELSQFEQPDTVEEVRELFLELLVPLLVAIDIPVTQHAECVDFVASIMAEAIQQKQQEESNTTWN
jgi:hypothetical protein